MSASVEETLIVVKPDGVERGLVGEILKRFEAKGFTVKRLQMLTMSRAQAKNFYGVHKDKPFFPGLVSFITSGPVVAMVLEGPKAVDAVRQLMGSTDPVKAAPGSVRGDLGLDIQANLVHGSDSAENAAQEIKLFFPRRKWE